MRTEPPPAARQGRKGKTRKAVALAPTKTCFIHSCTSPCKKDKKWCEGHNRTYDALSYQARRDGTEPDLDASLNEAIKAEEVMSAFVSITPPDGFFLKKKKINWSTFTQLFGHRTSKQNMEGAKPMTQHEFLNWAENKKRCTPMGAMNWWNELQTDISIRSDNDGRDVHGRLGEKQLWIPKAKQFDATVNERYQDTQVGSEDFRLRGATPDELNALKRHIDTVAGKPEDADFLGKSLQMPADGIYGARGSSSASIWTPKKKAKKAGEAGDEREHDATIKTADSPSSKAELDGQAGSSQPNADLGSKRLAEFRMQSSQKAALMELVASSLEEARNMPSFIENSADTFKNQTADEGSITEDLKQKLAFRESCCKAWQGCSDVGGIARCGPAERGLASGRQQGPPCRRCHDGGAKAEHEDSWDIGSGQPASQALGGEQNCGRATWPRSC